MIGFDKELLKVKLLGKDCNFVLKGKRCVYNPLAMKRKCEALTDHVSLPIKTVNANVRMFSELLVAVFAAESRRVITVYIEGIFLHGVIKNDILMDISGHCVDILVYKYGDIHVNKMISN